MREIPSDFESDPLTTRARPLILQNQMTILSIIKSIYIKFDGFKTSGPRTVLYIPRTCQCTNSSP